MEVKFGMRERTEADAIAPVAAPPPPALLDDAALFEKERELMAAAMAQSNREQAAWKVPDAELSAKDLPGMFRKSAVLEVVASDAQRSALLAAARGDALRLLRLESKSNKWWPKEGGVAPYFRAIAAPVAAACEGGAGGLPAAVETAYETANREIMSAQMDAACAVPQVFAARRPAGWQPQTTLLELLDDD